MKNFIQRGNNLTIPAPATVASGDFILAGALGGVAMTDAVSGAEVAIVRDGVFRLPKETGAAWAVGDQLYWDAANKRFTKTSSGNTKFGVATAIADSAAATGLVALP